MIRLREWELNAISRRIMRPSVSPDNPAHAISRHGTTRDSRRVRRTPLRRQCLARSQRREHRSNESDAGGAHPDRVRWRVGPSCPVGQLARRRDAQGYRALPPSRAAYPEGCSVAATTGRRAGTEGVPRVSMQGRKRPRRPWYQFNITIRADFTSVASTLGPLDGFASPTRRVSIAPSGRYSDAIMRASTSFAAITTLRCPPRTDTR